MIFDFNQLDTEMCIISLQIGNTITQQIEMPTVFAQPHFMQLIVQLRQDPRPMKVVCTKEEYTENGRRLINSLTFENKAFVDSNGK